MKRMVRRWCNETANAIRANPRKPCAKSLQLAGISDAAPGRMNARTRASEAKQETAFFLFMRTSHEALSQLGDQLRRAVEADIRPELQALWCELETKLLAHLEAEERFILPAFARVDREEALALLEEHGIIRALVLELGVAVELHYARLAPFERFAEILRAHAAREEALLYRWASTMLEPRLADAAAQHMTR